MTQDVKANEAMKKVSNAFALQLQQANYRVACLTEQRDGILNQLTDIQVLHKTEVGLRKELGEKLVTIQTELTQTQAQVQQWVSANDNAVTKVKALTWYCEQLLKQSPDSNGIHTIDQNLLNDIVHTHQAVLAGERVTKNIADVVRVTTASVTADIVDKAEPEKVEDLVSTEEAVEPEKVVALDHGLSSNSEDTSELDDLQIEEDTSVETKQPEKPSKGRNKRA